MNNLPTAAQDPLELDDLQTLLALNPPNPSVILEIGTKEHGWIAKMAPHFPQPCAIVAVDIADRYQNSRRAVAGALAARRQSLQLIIGDSMSVETRARVVEALAGRPVDLLHIDGLHTYEACRSDFEMYAPLARDGGFIVIHDIWHARDVGVQQFWAEIHRRTPTPFARSWAFHHWRPVQRNGDGPMGIGVLLQGKP